MRSSIASVSSSSVGLTLALALAACGSNTSRPEAGVVDPPDGPLLAYDVSPEDTTDDVVPARPCTLVLPECPQSAPPSYTRDIQPIVAQRCLPGCHEPGGIEQAQLLNSYSQIYAKRATVLSQIYHCKMPPPERPELPVDQVTTLLTWLVCGSPNN
jgi:hypothetical protein